MSADNGIPVDAFTERLVLGAVLLASDIMDSMRTTIQDDDFALDRHKEIWKACCSVYDSGGGVDSCHVWQSLQDAGKPESLSYLAEITDGVPACSIEPDVQRLKERASLRRLAVIGGILSKRACSGIDNSQELQEWLLQSAQDLTTGPKDTTPISTRDLVDKIGIQELLRPSKQKVGLRVPWQRLDHAIGGMRGGQMIVVAAYTSRGKSSLACQIATHCTKQGVGIFYWTTEMTPEALFRRMVDQMSGVDGLHHREGNLSVGDMQKAHRCVGWLYDHPVWFDRHSRTIPSMLAALRHVRAKYPIGLVVVDHLQHVKGAGRSDSRAREVSDVSRSLKMGSIDFDIPFLVVSQVSRPKEDGQQLTVHMLKESGDVENDADVILLLNSPKPAGLAPVSVSLNVAKQREGPAGFDIPLLFRPSTQAFESLEE